MELARHLGTLANCWFPFPNHFVYSLFREVIPDIPEDSPFDPSILAWKVMKVLPSNLKKKPFESLRNYLSEGATDLKLFQVSQRIADLFDSPPNTSSLIPLRQSIPVYTPLSSLGSENLSHYPEKAK